MSVQPFEIELPVGLGRQERRFENLDEFRDWQLHERAAWNWLTSNTSGQGGEYRELADRYNILISGYEQHLTALEQAINNDDDAAITRELDQIKGVANNFNAENLFYSYMPEGEFLRKIAEEESPFIAAFALRYLVGKNSNLSQPNAAEGVVRAILFRLPGDERSSAEHAALENLTEEYQRQITRAQRESSDSLMGAREAFSGFLREANRERDNYGEVIFVEQSEFNAIIEDAKGRLLGLEETYDKKLALQKSVNYWSQRKRRHWLTASVFGLVSLLGGIGVAIYIHSLISIALTSVNDVVHQPWKYGFVLIVLALAIWGLRLCVRMFLTNVHLATDAGERETMVLTYLALMREGNALKDEDKSLIFSALFRPGQAKLGLDDGAPISSAGMVSRLFSGFK